MDTTIRLPAMDDFEKMGQSDMHFKMLADIVKRNNGLWCTEAEYYLLSNF